MQEKIGQIINDWHLKATRTIYWQENAATEIAKLFERKVVWSGEGIANIDLFKPNVGDEWEPYTSVDCDGATLEVQGRIVEEDGQPVRVVVEEIDESRT